jgi:hypothetical protein
MQEEGRADTERQVGAIRWHRNCRRTAEAAASARGKGYRFDGDGRSAQGRVSSKRVDSDSPDPRTTVRQFGDDGKRCRAPYGGPSAPGGSAAAGIPADKLIQHAARLILETRPTHWPGFAFRLAYFALAGKAASLAMSSASCWTTRVAPRVLAIDCSRAIEARLSARSVLKGGTPPVSNCFSK